MRQRLGHVSRREPVGVEQPGVDVDLDLAVEPAGDRRLRDPVELLEPAAEHRLGQLLGLPQIGFSRHREHHDRLGVGIHPQDARPRRRLREHAAEVVHALADVEHREVHVAAPREAQRDQAHPLARHRGDPLHPGHRRRVGLHVLRDQPLDLAGRDVRIGGVDDELRVADVGEEVDREPGVGDSSQEEDRQEEHGDRHRPSAVAARHGSAHRPAYRDFQVDERVDEAVARLDQLAARVGRAPDGLLELLEGADAQAVFLACQLERLAGDSECAFRDCSVPRFVRQFGLALRTCREHGGAVLMG